MKRRMPRSLNPEERDLWERVARSTNPLASEQSPSSPKRKPEPLAPPSPRTKLDTELSIGSKASPKLPSHDLAASIADRVNAAPVRMDKNAFRKLKRGQTKPEARLDLHGMSVNAAHSALSSFIHSSQASGKRLVLVITGKGRASSEDGPIPTRVGVLRHQVPHWLGMPPLSPLILQVTHAHRKHGGDGALYVYLRR